MKILKAALPLIVTLIFFGCVDKNAIAQKLEKADKLVEYLSNIGMNMTEDRNLVNEAKQWYLDCSTKNSLSPSEERSISQLVKQIEPRFERWELYAKTAAKDETTIYFQKNPSRQIYWQFLAMGVLKVGMNRKEVTLLLGDPNTKETYSENQELFEKWQFKKEGTTLFIFFAGDFLKSWRSEK